MLLSRVPHAAADTGLTEELMKTTMTDDFNRVLEIQQSARRHVCNRDADNR
jgi:hypothetical protein